MRTQTVTEACGRVGYPTECIECRRCLNVDARVVVIGHCMHCTDCATREITVVLPCLRARLADVNAELQMSEPPTAISLLRQKQRELENRIVEIVEVLS